MCQCICLSQKCWKAFVKNDALLFQSYFISPKFVKHNDWVEGSGRKGQTFLRSLCRSGVPWSSGGLNIANSGIKSKHIFCIFFNNISVSIISVNSFSIFLSLYYLCHKKLFPPSYVSWRKCLVNVKFLLCGISLDLTSIFLLSSSMIPSRSS